MDIIDKCDMQLSFSDSARKSNKWYKKLFFHLIDLCVMNSYILMKSKSQKISLLTFRLNLISQIIEKYSEVRSSSSGGRRTTVSTAPLRLSGRHFPSPVLGMSKRVLGQRGCYVCKWTSKRPQKRKVTSYMCEECNVALCVHPCFQDYHTQKNFSIYAGK